jgi:hypothetical protein
VAGVLQHGFGNWGPMFEVGGGGSLDCTCSTAG